MADFIYKVNEDLQSLKFNCFHFLSDSREGESDKHCDKPLNGRLSFIYFELILTRRSRASRNDFFLNQKFELLLNPKFRKFGYEREVRPQLSILKWQILSTKSTKICKA